jgi:peptide/nickel transport system permease protein
LAALGTVLVALVVIFLAARTLPNNPVLARFGQHSVPESIEKEMARQGWDRPVWEQFGDYLWTFVTTGDLGQSLFRSGENVTEALLEKFPATVELTVAALLLALPLGVLLGVAAAVWRNRLPDYLCMTGALLGVSVPVFFLGVCMMTAVYALSPYVPVLAEIPTGRRMPIGVFYEPITGFHTIDTLLMGRPDLFAAALRHLLLPAIALASIPAAVVARITRSSMLDVLSADYVRTARAKGGSRWRVVMRHALPNASIPIANIAGLQASLLLSGAVLTETVFAWPGLGRYLVTAVRHSDYNVVQGAMLLIATVFVFGSLALDLLYAWLDPRVRMTGGSDG